VQLVGCTLDVRVLVLTRPRFRGRTAQQRLDLAARQPYGEDVRPASERDDDAVCGKSAGLPFT